MRFNEPLTRIRFGEILTGPVRNGVYKPSELRGYGAKIINMGELFANPRLRDIPMKRVCLTSTELAKSEVLKGDLLFARRSLTAEGAGKCCIVLEVNEPTTFESSLIRARPDPSKASPLFLFYYFNSPLGKHAIGTILRQVAVSGITGSDLSALEVSIPKLSTQSRIAEILGAIDDKIDLNRKQATNLESTARTLFRSWFVDFHPVRHKAAGGQSTLPREIADQFPDSFVESPIGNIPTGWPLSAVERLATIAGGGTPSTKEPDFWDGDNFWATPKDLAKLTAPILLTTERSITDSGLNHLSCGLLPKGTVLMSSRAPIGYIAIAAAPMAVNQGIIAMIPDKGVAASYLFLWCQSSQEQILARANGSTFQEISKKNFRSIPVSVPPSAIRDAFDRLVEPIFQQLENLTVSVRSLTESRDELLPRLMSGEIDVEGETLRSVDI